MAPFLVLSPLQDWSRQASLDEQQRQQALRSRTPSPLRSSTNPLLAGDSAYHTPLGVTPRETEHSPPRSPPTRYV